MSSPEEIQLRFESGLQTLRPTLFSFADQLVEGYYERRWELLIGDDTSGRLVTHFTRLALVQAGIAIPTKYIAASKSAYDIKPYDSFDMYAQYITEGLNPRGLIVTESIGVEATSLRFTHRVLAPYCETLDLAILGARAQPLAELGRIAGALYCGSIENREVQRAIWQTFENPTGETDIEAAWSGPLTNLTMNPDISRGDAMRLPDATYRALAHYAYERMTGLATEWANR